MCQQENEAIAAFICRNGITRYPTACAVPTQGLIAAADRVALGNHAAARGRARERTIAARERSIADRKVPVGPSD
jgi:uncharacterized protein YfaQ (DUF2300 family)